MNKEKFGFITLIGASNVGKSTLLNQLIGSKIAIVSPKVQTTRDLINGICIFKNAQIVFIDTPGIFSAKSKLEKKMIKTAWQGFSDADLSCLIIDSTRQLDENILSIIQKISTKNNNCLIINKIDLVNKTKLLSLADRLNKLGNFKKTFMISALKNDGIEDLKDYFIQIIPYGNWQYPEDEITTLPKKFLASEIVREKLFLNLDQEIPYSLSVETEKWEEFKNGSVKIHQVIYTTKDSHKTIIIGKSGKLLKKVGLTARLELEEILDQKVHLYIFVKVRENWIDKIF